MFDIFRNNTKILMGLLFLLIIPAFVLFGADGYQKTKQASAVVAKVDSIEISQAQWDAAHKNDIDRLRASRPELDTKLLDSPQARYATLERLIRDTVMRVAAAKSNLQTSDARLARYLQEDPTIASLRTPDGKLDMERYRQLAASQGLTPEGFENMVRQDISKQQGEAGVSQSGFVAAAPADVALNAFFERREIQVVNFLAKDYAAVVNPSDADLDAFYQANLSLFQAPEQVKIEYVVMDMDAVKNDIKISDADLKSFYDQNVARLSGNEERRASHILITIAKDAPEGQRLKAKLEAEALLKIVRSAPDSFADVAKKSSQDSDSAPKGGDLDFFGRGALVKQFEDAVFSMKKGEISDVVESDIGYHIIKLIEVKEPNQRSFEELRTSIESDLKNQQAQRKFAEVAELFTNTVYEQSDSLKPVSEKLGLEIKVAQALTRQPAPGATGVLSSEKFLSALFAQDNIDKKRNTEAVETAVNQLAAGRVVAYEPAKTLALADVRQQVRERVIAAGASELAKKDGMKKLALWEKEPDKAVLPPAQVVARDQAMNISAQVVIAALRVDAKSMPSWLGVDLGPQGYSVLRANKIVPRNEASQPSAAQERQQYAQWWTSAEAEAYYADLRDRLKVKILVAAPLS